MEDLYWSPCLQALPAFNLFCTLQPDSFFWKHLLPRVAAPLSVTCSNSLFPLGSSPDSSTGPWGPSIIGSHLPPPPTFPTQSHLLPPSAETYRHFLSRPPITSNCSSLLLMFSPTWNAFLSFLPNPNPPLLLGYFSSTQSGENSSRKAIESRERPRVRNLEREGNRGGKEVGDQEDMGAPTLKARIDWQQRPEQRQNSLCYFKIHCCSYWPEKGICECTRLWASANKIMMIIIIIAY